LNEQPGKNEAPKPRLRLIPCTRPDLKFTIRPQEGNPSKARGRCGHDIWQRERIMLGDQAVSTPEKDVFGPWGNRLGFVWQKCFTCLAGDEFQSAIVCAMCGGIIFRGQPVSMYLSMEDASNRPSWKHATWTFDRRATVNCMGWKCCPSGSFSAGHWHGDGVVTPYVTGTLAGDMFAGHLAGVETINIGEEHS